MTAPQDSVPGAQHETASAEVQVCGFSIRLSKRSPTGLYYATSEELPGLLVSESSVGALEASIPDAIGALLRAYITERAKPAASDLERAREIYGRFDFVDGQYDHILLNGHNVETLAAALAEAEAEGRREGASAMRERLVSALRQLYF